MGLLSLKALPAVAASVYAAASYPPKPADLTTPVQQRLAIFGPSGSCQNLASTI